MRRFGKKSRNRAKKKLVIHATQLLLARMPEETSLELKNRMRASLNALYLAVDASIAADVQKHVLAYTERLERLETALQDAVVIPKNVASGLAIRVDDVRKLLTFALDAKEKNMAPDDFRGRTAVIVGRFHGKQMEYVAQRLRGIE